MRAIREVASKMFCLFLYVCLATLFECLQIVYVLQNLKLGQIRVPVSWKTLMPWYLGTFGHTVPMNLLSAGKWAISFFVENLLFLLPTVNFYWSVCAIAVPIIVSHLSHHCVWLRQPDVCVCISVVVLRSNGRSALISSAAALEA